MTKKKVYPYWAFPSRRAFQRKKRADLRAAKEAIQTLQNGCAYLPGYEKHWHPLVKHLNALVEGARPRNWK